MLDLQPLKWTRFVLARWSNLNVVQYLINVLPFRDNALPPGRAHNICKWSSFPMHVSISSTRFAQRFTPYVGRRREQQNFFICIASFNLRGWEPTQLLHAQAGRKTVGRIRCDCCTTSKLQMTANHNVNVNKKGETPHTLHRVTLVISSLCTLGISNCTRLDNLTVWCLRWIYMIRSGHFLKWLGLLGIHSCDRSCLVDPHCTWTHTFYKSNVHRSNLLIMVPRQH